MAGTDKSASDDPVVRVSECVLLMGLQGSGKSAFFKRRFADSHIRINRDMLKTRARELKFFSLCLETAQSCVVDNTNAPVEERARFITAAKAKGFTATGYFFDVPVRDAIARNAARPEGQRIPVPGIYATAKRMRRPTYAEGFDALRRVTVEAGEFVVTDFESD